MTFNDVAPRSVKADRNGVFDFHGRLPLGAYKLYAEKDAEAYPDPLDSFYADARNEAAMVEMTATRPAAGVTVRLGEKAGVVSGRVIEGATGKDLKALLAFVDGEGNGHTISVDGS